MTNPFLQISQKIKSRTQAQWKQLFAAQYQQARGFIRENGEVAALIGFVLGVALVFFFKLFFFAALLLALAYLLILVSAPEE
jgi:hypothetical protein